MTHAAPAPGTRPPAVRPPGAPVPSTRPSGSARTPDLFSPRTHAVARWAVPICVGLLYGYWAAANQRGGGPVTGWNILFGFATALVFVAVYAAVRRAASRLRRGAHATAWASFWGVAFGFLYNQTGHSVLRSACMALVIAGSVFVVLFYRYYTRGEIGRGTQSP